MRLLFLGSGAFGLPTLQALNARHTLVGVVSQPDRPAGRGQSLTPTPIAEFAQASLAQSPLHRFENINDPAAIAALHALRANIWVVIAFGQKLSPELLAGVTAINLHASLLPRWRGAAPINAAILAGETRTGNSVITLAQRMDAGLVLGQSQREIEPTVTAGELHDILSADGPALVLDVIGKLAIQPASAFGVAQDESLVTKARKLSKADSHIDLTGPASACRARINGLSPWPGVNATLGGEAIRILRTGPALAGASVPTSATPGTLVDPKLGVVACSAGSAFVLLEVQAPGKKAMPYAAFAAGRKLTAGAVLTSP